MILSIGMLAFLIACIVTWRERRWVRDNRRRAQTAAERALVETGLTPSGDALGTFTLRGAVHGIDVELTNCTTKRPPGPSENDTPVCIAYVTAPIADQVVCKIAEIDQIMGPLPMVPRVRTSHVQFDAGYAVFVGLAGEPMGGSYRGASNASAVPWAQPSLLDRFVEFDLRWLRVQEGRVEVAFGPLPVEAAGRAAALAAAVALASQGKGIPLLSAGNPGHWLPWSEPGASWLLAWGVGTHVGIGAGIAVVVIAEPGVADSVGWLLAAMSIGAVFTFLAGRFLSARTKS